MQVVGQRRRRRVVGNRGYGHLKQAKVSPLFIIVNAPANSYHLHYLDFCGNK